ncbi:uncharacterized protein [Drosophila kikkawai]|uniref:Uncharacterized protein n=1 Tax=Drosophila kikkawai TaxID=30033 RepID=A0A6P4J6K0_DROKI|nr:eisosome protein SEG2-like [Drosophila kikkawai]
MEQTQKTCENTNEQGIEELPPSDEKDSGPAEPQDRPRGSRRARSLTDEFLAHMRRSLEKNLDEPKEKSSKESIQVVAEEEEPGESTSLQGDNEDDKDKTEASRIYIYATSPHDDEDTKPDQLNDDEEFEENEASVDDPESEIEDSSDSDVDNNV